MSRLAAAWRRARRLLSTRREGERQGLDRPFEWLSRYAHDVWFLFDSKLRIVEANDRALEVYGYDRQELLHLTLSRLRAPETRDTVSSDHARIRGGPGQVFETRHVRRDGSTFPVEVSARRFEVGDRTYFQSVVRDITERKAAEMETARHANLLLSVQDAVVGLDPEMRITSWNPAAQATYGWDAGEVLGRRCMDVFRDHGPCDRACCEPRLGEGQRVGLGHPRTSDAMAPRWSSRPRPRPVRDARGLVAGYVVVTRDLTERRRADAQHAYQSMLLENLAEAVIGLSTDFRIRSWNQAAERTFGYSAGEVEGHCILETLQPEVVGGTPETMRARFAEDGRVRFEARALAKDRTVVDVGIVGATVRDGAGERLGHVVIIRDIRERRRADAALNEAGERLTLALESTRDGLWDLDLADERAYLSPGWAERLGLATDPDGRAVFDAVVAPSAEARARWEDQPRRPHSPVPVRAARSRSSGDEVWLHIRGRVATRTRTVAPPGSSERWPT